eukprot:TRINITY_DN19583_c0_g1_i1.p1 TRINITY_DN19583_c0_g1~~TRINITY_DN19583_c0_g1_i1.p1  ORF type:complete len:319 (+),score=48.15 TRINITY_DN19583_c0_g1_i1:37-957(+)
MTEDGTCSKDVFPWRRVGLARKNDDADDCDLLRSTLRPAQDPELLALSFKPTTASLLALTFEPARDWPKREADREQQPDDRCFPFGCAKRACGTFASKICGRSSNAHKATRTQPDVPGSWSTGEEDAAGQVHPHLCSSLSHATYYWGNQPDGIDVGFCTCQQGFDVVTGQGFLKFVGREAEITDDGIQDVLDFMDAFTESSSAEGGFSVTYDLRSFGMPTMALVIRVANWGTEPHRRQRWEASNTACQLVISQGWRLYVAKGFLTTFFSICAPTCRTALLTVEDGVETEEAVWEPPYTADSGNPQG